MRKLALWLSFLLVGTFATPGLAEEDDAEKKSSAPEIVSPLVPELEEEEDSGFAEYRSAVGNRYLIGLNSFITFPADPVMSTVSPDEGFDELPLASATKWPVGFFQGTLLMAYRASMGVLDLCFAPLTPMRMLSPEPRYLLFANAEHEEY